MVIRLKNASLRFLRDVVCRVSSQVLPAGYSEDVHPLIRRFCLARTGRHTNIKVDDKFSYQGAADLPRGNSDHDGEPSHDIHAMRKEFRKHGHKKRHGTKANNSVPRVSQKGCYHVKKLPGRAFQPYIFQIVLDTPRNVLRTVLDKWMEDGNHLERNEVLLVLFHLRKQLLYNKALQFMEWIERRKLLNFEERDYACHLDLIARNHGIEAAQKYIERVPKPFRNEVLYETLLVNCVCLTDIQKAEQVFKEIRDLFLPLTISVCNQMILLYKRVARNKVVDILMLMEKENIKPSPFTYRLLINLKGQSNDISGMELVLNMMKDNGVEPDFATQTMVAKFYISGGLTEKAEEVIRAMEVYIKDKRHAIRSLLDLYAVLGRPDDVARIWKLCTEPKLEDFLAAIEAWGKLGRIEQVEETFEALLKTSPKLTSKYYNAMLKVYAGNELLAKGKEFLERMCFSGCPNGPLTWDALVKLYVNSGELEKANSFLLNVTEENPDRNPLFGSYIILLKAYAEKGDVRNAEMIFDRLKKIRYPGRTPPYGFLLEAYVNAEVTPHGFRERMRADNVCPSKPVIEQLKRLDNLQKGAETIE
ncbi:pentatricopeptide repeat-containing protein At1g80270, mitochondrial-like [Phragmites australis]|uniref:pentatricopeptide repeat-containing protein At1g80270, mitochondrial-like n=1 Tax=Phragmites australis TaxID=29695 RepID=UPI002D789AEF|nr:pentatricopeptide repeat-containing protein At1g80270, mitochondrial-like [Phragmites australis]